MFMLLVQMAFLRSSYNYLVKVYKDESRMYLMNEPSNFVSEIDA